VAEQTKLRTTLPLIRERVEALQYLARKDLTPKLNALELQQELVEAEQDLTIQNHRLTQLDALIVTLRDGRRSRSSGASRCPPSRTPSASWPACARS
jgi:hemolysin D